MVLSLGEFVVRIRHILDPELKQRVIAKLAEARGLSPAAVPEWFELDDADYVDLLNAIREEDEGLDQEGRDSRM